MQAKLLSSMPPFLLAIFIFIANLAMGLHDGLSTQPSAFFNLVYVLGMFWGLNWWLMNDSQKHKWNWFFSWGNFLYLAAWILVPLYLFKTRGIKAFLILLLVIGLFFVAYVTGLVSGAMLSALSHP